MIVTDTSEIPEGAEDVTDAVNDLKEELSTLFQGKGLPVIGIAIGVAIGETLDDPETIKGILTTICEMAGTTFALTNQTPLEGETIQ